MAKRVKLGEMAEANKKNGGRQKITKGHTLRRSKFWFPTAEKTVLIRARSLESAAEIFRRFHGPLDTVNLKKVRREEVSYEEIENNAAKMSRFINTNIKG